MTTDTSFALHAEVEKFQQEVDHMSAQLVSEMEQLVGSCRSMIEQHNDKRKKLENREAKLKFDLVDKNKALGSLYSALKSLETKKAELEGSMNVLPKQLEDIRKLTAEHKATIETLEAELRANLKSDNAEVDNCSKSCELYKNSLGLEISKLPEGAVQFDFQYIDQKNPEKVFSFQIKLDSNRRYMVPMCTPNIGHLDQLVTELNERDARREQGLFGWFVQRMRKEFCGLAEQSAAEEKEKSDEPTVSYIA
eukprot:CAMPEP_0197517430 /NCGR_PEP_ID=MMETSP1318-20131121/2442_1 /TAXON_ID=552666 /ORGANISM="Partenskyella glossopodia, Strain RCC365" /LENGTH=250 /DNA_ID=CAMNT_0043066983 /DNA_START=42 /DNA_END=794 /DNA_ORIENTATION=+